MAAIAWSLESQKTVFAAMGRSNVLQQLIAALGKRLFG
jgi:hypothetical protein